MNSKIFGIFILILSGAVFANTADKLPDLDPKIVYAKEVSATISEALEVIDHPVNLAISDVQKLDVRNDSLLELKDLLNYLKAICGEFYRGNITREIVSEHRLLLGKLQTALDGTIESGKKYKNIDPASGITMQELSEITSFIIKASIELNQVLQETK